VITFGPAGKEWAAISFLFAGSLRAWGLNISIFTTSTGGMLALVKPAQETVAGGMRLGIKCLAVIPTSVLVQGGAPEARKFLGDPVRPATPQVTTLPSHKAPSDGEHWVSVEPIR
jgi:hypothetical protein